MVSGDPDISLHSLPRLKAGRHTLDAQTFGASLVVQVGLDLGLCSCLGSWQQCRNGARGSDGHTLAPQDVEQDTRFAGLVR